MLDQGNIINLDVVCKDQKFRQALSAMAVRVQNMKIVFVPSEDKIDEYISVCDIAVTRYDVSVLYKCFFVPAKQRSKAFVASLRMWLFMCDFKSGQTQQMTDHPEEVRDLVPDAAEERKHALTESRSLRRRIVRLVFADKSRFHRTCAD